MSVNRDVDLEWAKFHWEKWQDEAKRFWKHLFWATVGLVVLSLYQVNVI